MTSPNTLFDPLTLPCGVTLKNRLAKSAMSDSLGDGTGHPTPPQVRLYQRWAEGGVGLSIIGEVQGSPFVAEKPGNLVLNGSSDLARFQELSNKGRARNAHLWVQLGHGGALAYAPTSTPQGPSALDLPDLQCTALSCAAVKQAPADFAHTAKLAKDAGFGGVQIHAAHGFLLSQFLSPLFNKRTDAYGGSLTNRMRLLLETIETVRTAVGPSFPIAVKLNSSDQLHGGLTEDDSLQVVAALDRTSIDLIDISGGTYFPGAKSASDATSSGPYFLTFARRARALTSKPLMLTGGFKTYDQAHDAVSSGIVDVVGLARAMALEPSLPDLWRAQTTLAPQFPRFATSPQGGVTAWYTMRLSKIATGNTEPDLLDLDAALETYEARDKDRTDIWLRHFGPPN
ncbi:NADH:flavin oxidoreductase/NADH oxidase family protein [Shimia haliotis]|uniref:2,4-dienoyl-CoA reductase n=1 Tax=Shimia haliotis TaxID=1280847 RepID=A0A1I4F1S2_9RHOB|nr:NADH:flavin oxidoreductase/NADH oxidase family protein [Shimia haliotis]SFL10341.1 2,4-dienoyl-CoA reductase [Shimia haliotis]